MKKSVLLLASMVLALILVGGAAWAATIQCSNEESKCVGTSGPDTIYGADTNHDFGYGDDIRGREGDDRIYGRGGDDRERDSGGGLHGDDGDDVVRGGRGNDSVYGGRGSDRVFGGPGSDSITGETHNYVGPAPDFISGGEGDDFIYAGDSTRDRIYCGLGYDTVLADNVQGNDPDDRRDFVDDSCEDVTRR